MTTMLQWQREPLLPLDPGACSAMQALLTRGSRGTMLLHGSTAAILDAHGQWVAAAHLCHRENAPCGSCESCIKILSANHPDGFLLAPEGGSIKIDDARGLARDLGRTGFVSGRRAVLIRQLDLATEEAANALLKTLEEPPSECWIIGTAANAQAVLETVRSRCLPIAIGGDWQAQWDNLCGATGSPCISLGNPALAAAAAVPAAASLAAFLVRMIEDKRTDFQAAQKEIKQLLATTDMLPDILESIAWLWLRICQEASLHSSLSAPLDRGIEGSARFPYNIRCPAVENQALVAELCDNLAAVADDLRANRNPGMSLENWIIEARLSLKLYRASHTKG